MSQRRQWWQCAARKGYREEVTLSRMLNSRGWREREGKNPSQGKRMPRKEVKSIGETRKGTEVCGLKVTKSTEDCSEFSSYTSLCSFGAFSLFTVRILTGVRRYLTIVLVCTSLIANTIEVFPPYTFRSLHFFFRHVSTVYSNTLPVFKLDILPQQSVLPDLLETLKGLTLLGETRRSRKLPWIISLCLFTL